MFRVDLSPLSTDTRQFLSTLLGLFMAVSTRPEEDRDKSPPPPFPPREVSARYAIQTALGGIKAALASLDSVLVNNDIGLTLLLLSMNVPNSIRNTTRQTQTSLPLISIADASDLKATTDSLTANVNLIASDPIEDQPGFKKLGVVDQVAFGLRTLKVNFVQLAQTVASRVSVQLSPVAAQAVGKLESVIARGIYTIKGSRNNGTRRVGVSSVPAPSACPRLPSANGPPPSTSNPRKALGHCYSR